MISFKGLGSSIVGKFIWQTVCLALIWVVWQERNVQIFQDKARVSEALWDVIHLFASFWASCIIAFKDVVQLDQFLVYSLKGVGQQGEVVWKEIIQLLFSVYSHVVFYYCIVLVLWMLQHIL